MSHWRLAVARSTTLSDHQPLCEGAGNWERQLSAKKWERNAEEMAKDHPRNRSVPIQGDLSLRSDRRAHLSAADRKIAITLAQSTRAFWPAHKWSVSGSLLINWHVLVCGLERVPGRHVFVSLSWCGPPAFAARLYCFVLLCTVLCWLVPLPWARWSTVHGGWAFQSRDHSCRPARRPQPQAEAATHSGRDFRLVEASKAALARPNTV